MPEVSPARHMVLVGLMATGKSTVGAILADRLGRPLVDTDSDVETAAGRAVRDIWSDDGEAEFRRLESVALAAALERDDPTVIAAAGGVVLADGNRALLSSPDVDVIWLRAAPATLLQRVRRAHDEHRPLLDGDPAGMLETMFADRTDLYASVADVVVDVDTMDVDDVVAAIIDHCGGEAT